jgi:ATP-dependent exoDNAse (exonuclease V) alpha subunit
LSKAKGSGRKERVGLQDVVDLAVGLKVMVTFNVNTDLDIANGTRGVITKIVLDDREPPYSMEDATVTLKYLPLYVLVKLTKTKTPVLEGLEEGVVPIVPMTKTYTFQDADGNKKTVNRAQLPMTMAYAFTDYRSQGQTITYPIIDIGRPPTNELTPFNAYVALSRGHGRESIRLLRDFDDKMFTRHPNEYLRLEDERLRRLNKETETWWTRKNAGR